MTARKRTGKPFKKRMWATIIGGDEPRAIIYHSRQRCRSARWLDPNNAYVIPVLVTEIRKPGASGRK